MRDLFLDRVPPQNKEAEQSVLVAVFLSKDALIPALELLRPEDFYTTAHQRIFQTMVDLYEKG
ncbi:replicative DNA helicase, partial [Acinetobacter baumannii]